MASENNMVAAQALREIAVLPHQLDIGYAQDIAKFTLARLAQSDAQQGASLPASGEGVGCRHCNPCPNCRGAGMTGQFNSTCSFCNGTGRAAPLAAATPPAVPQEGRYRARSLHADVRPGFHAVVDGPDGWPIAHCAYMADAERIATALTGAGENGEQGA